jgi:hypothetical protein
MEIPRKINSLINFHFKFNHLTKINQPYFHHFRDALFYSAVCVKLAFCFFVHGLYPDAFVNSSIELSRLNTLIKMKYTNKQNEKEIIKENKTNSLFYYFTTSTEKFNFTSN